MTPQLFYSRRIGLNRNRVVPIDVGGRLTGKVGKFSVGRPEHPDGRGAAGAVALDQFHGAAREARRPAAQQRRRHVHQPFRSDRG